MLKKEKRRIEEEGKRMHKKREGKEKERKRKKWLGS